MPNAYICDPSECARLNKNDAFIFKTRKITHNFMRKILQPSKCSRSVPMHFSSPTRNASNSKAISTPMFLTSFDDVEFFFGILSYLLVCLPFDTRHIRPMYSSRHLNHRYVCDVPLSIYFFSSLRRLCSLLKDTHTHFFLAVSLTKELV